MTREEFNTNSTEILTILSGETPDNGRISELLDGLRTGFNDEVSRAETAEASRDELRTKNEGLQRANMNLFMRLGAENTDPKPGADLSPKQPEKIDFNSLFNDKGELI